MKSDNSQESDSLQGSGNSMESDNALESENSMESDGTIESSSESSSSQIEFNIISETNPDLNDLELFLEQSRIFTSLDSLDKSILQCISVKSDDTVLSFLLILKYENLLKLISKIFKKIINKVIESNLINEYEGPKRFKEDQVEKVKRNLSLLYTERACELEPSLILEMYKKIEINNEFIYIILSRIEQLDKNKQEKAFKDFCDFDKEHLNYLPIRIEEIFLLKVTDLFKMTKINGKDYRVFFLKSNELKDFMKLLESEIQK
ncbi:hypothetical protein NBO_1020g0002 [Nosema bombycis CQ1]|uniref:Uncharacterized protein n=1 Tax=Nosema bombycis (strain CQ1 / CVCC 102059) TaxID=578461 RepID=R0MC30_NOSB1|nr:hypothetical protein NBO_1020g0002 [Nosema bombycis CQ1]|eukprot:EOB11610.1 hypothetical protein NBO_1020g0002 [Nosema bombycis CQ1]